VENKPVIGKANQNPRPGAPAVRTETKPAVSQAGNLSGEEFWEKLNEKVSANRELCIFISEVRGLMASKPDSEKLYVEAFLAAIPGPSELGKTKLQMKSLTDQLTATMNAAAKLDGPDSYVYRKRLVMKRIPKERWKGKWNDKTEQYEPRKPASHAPAWFRKLGIDVHAEGVSSSDIAAQIDGFHYCQAFDSAANMQELMRELWFVGKDAAAVRDVIEDCHKDLNDWCERNGKKKVSMKKDRKNYLTAAQAKRFIKSKDNPMGFITDK